VSGWTYHWDDDDRPKQHAPAANRYASHKDEIVAYGWGAKDIEPDLVDYGELQRLTDADALAKATAAERARYERNRESERIRQSHLRAQRRERQRQRELIDATA